MSGKMTIIKIYEGITGSSAYKKISEFNEFDYKHCINFYNPALEIVGIKIYLKEREVKS